MSSDCAVQKTYPGKFADAIRETSGTYRTPAGAFGTDNPSWYWGWAKPPPLGPGPAPKHTPLLSRYQQLLAPPPPWEIQMSSCTCAAVAEAVSGTQPDTGVLRPCLQNVTVGSA